MAQLSMARTGATRLHALRGLLDLAFFAAAVFLAARLCLALPRGTERIAPIWLPNAIALATLLRSPGRRWPALTAACGLGHALASLSTGYSPAHVAVLVGASVAEYLSAATVLRALWRDDVGLERARRLAALCAVCIACALVAGALGSVGLWLVSHDDPVESYRAWALSHPLSLMLATPCLLVLSRPRLHLGGGRLSTRAGLLLAATAALAAAIFLQSRFPVLFLLPPALVAVSLEAGLFGAALAVLVTAAVALPATMLGLGPIALSHGDVLEKITVLQLFLTVTLWSSLPVAGLQARQRHAQAQVLEEARRARRAEALALDSEARYRSLTEGVSDAIAALDAFGRLTFISPAVERITGHASDELVGRPLAELIHPEDLPHVQSAFRELQKDAGRSGSPIEYRIRSKDGRVVWLQANPRIVRDEAGTAVGTVDVVRDVTAHKTMELQLEAALQAAEAGVRAKSEFLANISHELRTPLTGILGYAEVLEGDAGLPHAARRHAERIRSAGASLLALVNDLLDLSRAEAGELKLHPRRTDLSALLHACVDLVRPQAQQAALALSVEHEASACEVMVDPDRLQQVVVNLLANAVKFTSRGVVTASLRCRPAEDGVDVRLSVSDTGVGIAPHRLDRIFDRFEQGDASTSRRYGGAGLGLAISRTLIDAMGGTLSAQSTPGTGSVFTLRLRLPRADAAADPSPEETPVSAGASDLAGARVLLAEDVALNRDLVGLFLQPLGVHLHTVENGAEAVEAAAACAFDVILMDMQMPVMDGLEATRRIRAGAGPSARARIVALTANVLPDEIARCREAGMDDHLGKPLTAAALEAKLRAPAGTEAAEGDAAALRAAV